MEQAKTLGELKAGGYQSVSVKNELRANLIRKLRAGERLFPGVVGYDETVIPQLVNAILARHNLILLGLRGQAKSRIIRQLTELLDEHIPIIAGSEINDDPFHPISAFGRQTIGLHADATQIAWVDRDSRFVEKLATPDVTIADIIGDVDPIKAAKGGHLLSDELTIHYGLLPRANRGIFAINELPDLAGKIQVGLFNIMQEGDVQIKGYPVRLRLDVMLIFSANPEDYTARGKIITPLKDRIGAEIMTHYPADLQTAVEITKQEAWVDRNGLGDSKSDGLKAKLQIPDFIRETIEQIADRIEAAAVELGGKEVPSSFVGTAVMNELHGIDQIAYVRIASVYRSFKDIDEFMHELEDLIRLRKDNSSDATRPREKKGDPIS